MSDQWHELPGPGMPSPVLAVAAGGDEWWAGGYGGVSRRHGDAAWECPGAILPIAPVTALAWASGTLVAGGTGGIAISRDAGQTWVVAEVEGAVPVVTAIAVSPRFEADGVMLAATLGAGILRSDDGGRSWRPATFGLGDLDVIDLAWGDSGIVLAGTAHGLSRSPNDGRAWKLVLDTAEDGIAAVAFRDDGTAVAVTDEGKVLHSPDGGMTWSPRAPLPGGIQATALLPVPGALLLGTAGDGVWRSDAAGDRWANVTAGTFLALAGQGARVVAGTDAGIVASDDGGTNWGEAASVPLGDWQRVLADRDALLVSGTHSQPMRLRHGGWETVPVPSTPLTALLSAPDGALLAASPDGLARSEDGGSQWDSPVPGERGCVTHITFGAGDAGWAASADATRLFGTTDAGLTWHEMDTPPFARLALVALQAMPDGLVAVTRPPRPGAIQVWHSSTGGETWERGVEATTRWPVACALAEPPLLTIGGAALAQGPDGAWQRAVITERGGIRRVAGGGDGVVCLSSAGLHRSRDRGHSWSIIDPGFPVNEAVDIALVNDTLTVLLTGGRLWQRSLLPERLETTPHSSP